MEVTVPGRRDVRHPQQPVTFLSYARRVSLPSTQQTASLPSRQAKTLLSTTRKSIKTISYEVGYDDASFFARLFRQHTELSPNQYRQQYRLKSG